MLDDAHISIFPHRRDEKKVEQMAIERLLSMEKAWDSEEATEVRSREKSMASLQVTHSNTNQVGIENTHK